MKKIIGLILVTLSIYSVPYFVLASNASRVKKKKATTAKVENSNKAKVAAMGSSKNVSKTSSNNVLENDLNKTSRGVKHDNIDDNVRNDGHFYHIVAVGETLQSIADLYDISIKDIILWNRLTDSNVGKGSQLWIKSMDEFVAHDEYSWLLDDDNFSNDEYLISGDNDNSYIHIVATGETLASIAQTYGVSVRELILWNNLSDNDIAPGDKIIILTNN